MSFTVTTDEEVFRRFWLDEKENSPRYLNDAGDVWHTSFDDFLDFCSRSTVYHINDNALVYIEPSGEVHFSVIRDSDKSGLCKELVELRNDLFRKRDLLYAWIGSHNRNLQRMVEGIGFRYDGFQMFKGFTHKRLFEWRCFILRRDEFYCLKPSDNLLLSL